MNISSVIGNPATGLVNSLNMKGDADKVNSFEDQLNSAVNSKDDEQLKKACKGFESYFIQTMYKEMRKTTMSDSSFMPKGQAEQMFQDMLDEENSKNATEGGGIGLAQMLYKQMSKSNTAVNVKAN